jgi:hypothetical protein
MTRQEVFDPLAHVCREVVGDHVDLIAARLIDHDVGEERDELSGGVPLRSTGRARQFRVFAILGLDMRPFIDAKYGRMRRRVQIQTDDIGRFLLKIRIVRGRVALYPLRGFVSCMAFGQQQNQPRSSSICGPIRPAACSSRQFLAIPERHSLPAQLRLLPGMSF